MGTLLRVYTQNVDGLETAAGPRTAQGRDLTRATMRSKTCILLHGIIDMFKCMACGEEHEWKKGVALFESGCPACLKRSEERARRGGRRVRVGLLLPAIVYSGEEHPQGAKIETAIGNDENGADLLIILGTSLKTARGDSPSDWPLRCTVVVPKLYM